MTHLFIIYWDVTVCVLLMAKVYYVLCLYFPLFLFINIVLIRAAVHVPIWPLTLSCCLAFVMSAARSFDVLQKEENVFLPNFIISEYSLISPFLSFLPGAPGGRTSLQVQLWSGIS